MFGSYEGPRVVARRNGTHSGAWLVHLVNGGRASRAIGLHAPDPTRRTALWVAPARLLKEVRCGRYGCPVGIHRRNGL
jgi:hypothetical protein